MRRKRQLGGEFGGLRTGRAAPSTYPVVSTLQAGDGGVVPW